MPGKYGPALRSGRNRLIIQPKPMPASTPPAAARSLRRVLTQVYRISRPVLDARALLAAARGYPRYLLQLYRYLKMSPNHGEREFQFFPVLGEDTPSTGFSEHYLYLGDWALRRVQALPAPEHVDVASQLHWVAAVATFKPITFIDIRPAEMEIANLTCKSGSLLALPYRDQEVPSLSCLHVVEHVGLGRYGDPLDPEGTHKSVRELARVLAPGGTLLLALPVGRPQLVFNAHRVHSPAQIIAWLRAEGLRLASFAAVTDAGKYLTRAEPADYETADYACGMFEFVR